MLENFNVEGLLNKEGKFLTLEEEHGQQDYDWSVSESFPKLMGDKQKEIINMLSKHYKKKMTSTEQKAKYIMDRVQSELGLTPIQAAGLAGNIYQESKFNPKAVGDRGAAHGIAQWHPNRRKGKNILNMSFEDQVSYLIQELKGPENSALRKIIMTGNIDQAAWAVDKYYERSDGKSTKSRIKYATDFLKLFNA